MRRSTFSTLLLLQCIAVGSLHVHSCSHDEIGALHSTDTTPVELPYQHGGRRLQSTVWAPIRMHTEFRSIAIESSTAKADFLQYDLIPAALARWTELLDVIPTVENLRFARNCEQWWSGTAKCAVYAASTSCGPSDTTATNVSITIPPAQLRDDLLYDSSTATPTPLLGGNGIANADHAVYVYMLSSPVCSQGTLAYASTCQTDQYDRPILSYINFCPNAVTNASIGSDSYNFQLSIALHELGHALGFSASSWPKFRNKDANRTPKTPRDTLFTSRIAAAYTVSLCGAPKPFAATNTLRFISERGMQCSYNETFSPMSNCVQKHVGPRSLAISSDYFDCSTMNGIELENHDTGNGCSPHSSHLESRVFRQSLMAAWIAQGTPTALTAIELAVLDDSGWYEVHYEKADSLPEGRWWGYKQGCSFATSPCNGEGAVGNPQHFFASSAFDGVNRTDVCLVDRRYRGLPQFSTYTSALPTQYRYFPMADRGGSFYGMDFCPVAIKYANGDCWNPANDLSLGLRGETYAVGSMCMQSTLCDPLVSGGCTSTTGCYAYTCESTNVLVVTISATYSSPKALTVRCTNATVGVATSLPNFQGSIRCPNPAHICRPPTRYTPPSSASPTPSSPLTSTITASRSGSITSSQSTGPTHSASPSLSTSSSLSTSQSTLPSISQTPPVSPAATTSLAASPSTTSMSASISLPPTPTPSQSGSNSPESTVFSASAERTDSPSPSPTESSTSSAALSATESASHSHAQAATNSPSTAISPSPSATQRSSSAATASLGAASTQPSVQASSDAFASPDSSATSSGVTASSTPLATTSAPSRLQSFQPAQNITTPTPVIVVWLHFAGVSASGAVGIVETLHQNATCILRAREMIATATGVPASHIVLYKVRRWALDAQWHNLLSVAGNTVTTANITALDAMPLPLQASGFTLGVVVIPTPEASMQAVTQLISAGRVQLQGAVISALESAVTGEDMTASIQTVPYYGNDNNNYQGESVKGGVSGTAIAGITVGVLFVCCIVGYIAVSRWRGHVGVRRLIKRDAAVVDANANHVADAGVAEVRVINVWTQEQFATPLQPQKMQVYSSNISADAELRMCSRPQKVAHK